MSFCATSLNLSSGLFANDGKGRSESDEGTCCRKDLLINHNSSVCFSFATEVRRGKTRIVKVRRDWAEDAHREIGQKFLLPASDTVDHVKVNNLIKNSFAEERLSCSVIS